MITRRIEGDDRYDKTEYRCNGCRHRWETIDCDPWPAVRYHVETCNATVSMIEHREMVKCGIWASYVARREALGRESWAIS